MLPRDWFLSCLNLSPDGNGMSGWGPLRTKESTWLRLVPEFAVPQTDTKWHYSTTAFYSIREAEVLQIDTRGSLVGTGIPL